MKHLFDHRVRVWRNAPTRDAYGDKTEAFAPLASAPASNNARPDQAWSGALQDQGAGEEQAAKRRWYLDRSVVVAERDVLQVVAGPESPATLRVVSVTKPTAPQTVHHLEVNVEAWQGTLTES